MKSLLSMTIATTMLATATNADDAILDVHGEIQINGTTVIDSNGKVTESALPEGADGRLFDLNDYELATGRYEYINLLNDCATSVTVNGYEYESVEQCPNKETITTTRREFGTDDLGVIRALVTDVKVGRVLKMSTRRDIYSDKWPIPLGGTTVEVAANYLFYNPAEGNESYKIVRHFEEFKVNQHTFNDCIGVLTTYTSNPIYNKTEDDALAHRYEVKCRGFGRVSYGPEYDEMKIIAAN
ncbi:hypothetical protein F7U66_01385 [Vibrio parahaemolyticus]|nr:hypothetical protein [Vibrio parahaemolyticus]